MEPSDPDPYSDAALLRRASVQNATLDVYSHVLEPVEREATDRIEGVIFAK